MADAVHLTLLGTPAAHCAGVPLRCPSRKAFALFAFLALDRRTHARRSLAALFWGRRDEEAARASLRATLHRLPQPMAECLAIERESLALSNTAPLRCDVQHFESLCEAGDLQQMQEATRLYGGHLLADFEADATPEFDDWLSRERARLKQVAYQAFDRVIASHYARSSRAAPGSCDAQETARAIARHWLALEPAAERAHRWLIRFYRDAGDAEAVQAQYDQCQRALAIAEGRAPAAETRALAEATGEAQASGTGAAASTEPMTSTAFAPPVAATSFVGRLEDVAQLVRLMGEPGCRLITLHGLGGVGKTRLAHVVASQVVARFAQGCTWVALEGVERPDAVADTLVRALGIEITPRLLVRDALLQRLRSQQRLLVLDNFEHLLAGDDADAPVDLLLAILREAPGVRLLVTSREALGVQEEWVYGVEGLDYGGNGRGGEEGGAASAAVELFAQRARQAYLGFSLAAEMPHVLRICSHVDGLPLGIELAAAWVRTIPCAEIAQELDRGVEPAPRPHRNRPQRQQSLRAVIEFSWRLLAREHQDVLAALSQFRGGFTRDAAAHVAQASLRTLSSLVDKALVRRSSESRFSLHPLVRWFAAEQLAASASRRSAAAARHADHFMRLLVSQRLALSGTGHAQALRLLEDDLDNIRAAWNAQLEGGDLRALCACARPLSILFDRLGLYDEWNRTLERTIQTAECASPARAELGELFMHTAYAHWRRGDAARAEACRARAIAELADDEAGHSAELHRLSGLIAREAGDFGAALEHFAASAAAAERAGDLILGAQLANEIGVVHFRRGDLQMARAAFVESRERCEASAYAYDKPVALHNIGYCDLELGRFDEADEAFGQALQAFRERADARGEAMVLSSLGILARRRGDFVRAEQHSRASVALAERVGNLGAVADAHDDLAQVLERRGDLERADAHYGRALAMARELGQEHLVCFVLLHRARACASAGRTDVAALSLREALQRAAAHDFRTGILMGIAGAARVRMMSADPATEAVAARWCRAVLAAAGSNIDVRDAIPPLAAGLLAGEPRGEDRKDQAIEAVLTECLGFLDEVVSPDARPQPV